MAVISESGRQALINYKYQSTLKSWLDTNIMQDWWEWVVLWMPLWLAPNVITFTGTLQFIFSTLIFSYFCDDLMTCQPPWLYIMLAISLFIYQTLDAIDGKQARRTHQSSPLGQLFDHGNDAFIVTPILVACYATTQYGKTWQFLLIMMSGYLVFYMLNWRARHEGVMTFGVFSVTESQFVGISVFLSTSIFGCEMWTYPFIFGVLDLRNLTTIFLFIVIVFTTMSEYKAVDDYYKKGKGKNKKDPGKHIELFHLSLFLIGCLSWNLTGVLDSYPWTFLWIICFLFCGMIHRLIVADLTHMKSDFYYHLLSPLWVMIVGSWYEFIVGIDSKQSFMNSDVMVYGILVYVVFFWAVYVTQVINEITDTLDIRLFVITHKKK